MNDGQLELMVHRRLFRDDGKGVAEPLDEPGQFGKGLIIRGKHYVLVDSISRSNFHRRLGQHFMLRPHVMFFVDEASPKEFVGKYHASVRMQHFRSEGIPHKYLNHSLNSL